MIHSEIEIAASPERVWEVLSDFASFPEWNPFVFRVVGKPEVGARLALRVTTPGWLPTRFYPTVLAVTPNRELRWIANLLPFGLLTGDHLMAIEPLGPDRVRFINDEHFGGALAPLFEPLLSGATRSYVAMNEALKRRVAS